jgi:hypothetical protein
MTATEISNTDDVIDSRDVIARIEALESEESDLLEALDAEDYQPSAPDELEQWREEYGEELAALKKLAEEAEGYAADWKHGETLIRDSYFKEYAQELAEDIGAINSEASWPNNCIDWDQAARELQMDYTAVDFDGVTYWIR